MHSHFNLSDLLPAWQSAYVTICSVFSRVRITWELRTGGKKGRPKRLNLRVDVPLKKIWTILTNAWGIFLSKCQRKFPVEKSAGRPQPNRVTIRSEHAWGHFSTGSVPSEYLLHRCCSSTAAPTSCISLLLSTLFPIQKRPGRNIHSAASAVCYFHICVWIFPPPNISQCNDFYSINISSCTTDHTVQTTGLYHSCDVCFAILLTPNKILSFPSQLLDQTTFFFFLIQVIHRTQVSTHMRTLGMAWLRPI